MNRLSLLMTAGLCASLALGACGPATGGDDAAFGARVRAYLLAHPEVIEEATERLQAKQDAEDAAALKKARAALPRYRAALERDPRDFVANPNGKITVTEFYDYRCPHCADAAPQVLALIKDNPDIRFVFKEMPIFGATSEHAAYAAIAVKKAGGDYLGLYGSLMATHPLDAPTVDKIAIANGAKPTDLSPSAPATAQLAATDKLFKDLSLGGTPAFIVGNEIIPGADMEALAAAIVKARKGSGQG
jgi:protein-disulfide isomerase